MSLIAKVALRGKYLDETTSETKTATIATISNIQVKDDIDEPGHSFEQLISKAADMANSAQKCVSATLTGFTVTTEEVKMEEPEFYKPGDPLRSEEIFSEDFSDTQVVPTLQITNANAAGIKKTFSFKYMADPIDTQDFNENVGYLSENLGELIIVNKDTAGQYDTFIKGDMSFSAKDTVVEPD